jgi:hypothetical protein
MWADLIYRGKKKSWYQRLVFFYENDAHKSLDLATLPVADFFILLFVRISSCLVFTSPSCGRCCSPRAAYELA